MAKTKSSTRNQHIYSRIKSPVKPKWMRVTKTIAMVVLGALMLLAIAGILIKYYQFVSTYK
jgi:hypothetical protein